MDVGKVKWLIIRDRYSKEVIYGLYVLRTLLLGTS